MRSLHWVASAAVVWSVSACAGSETYDPAPTSAAERFAIAARDMCASTHGRASSWETDARGRVHCFRERRAP